MIFEGFWKSRTEPDLPMPVELTEPWGGQSDFLIDLEEVESHAEFDQYRGLSGCRICQCLNGSREYKTPGARWPQGLKHYISEHNVKPSETFQAYITALAHNDIKAE